MHDRQIIDWMKQRAPGTNFLDRGGLQIPWIVENADNEYAALTGTVALAPVPEWASILAEGADAADYLHRRLTQSIRSLPLGSGTQALLLGADGRMLADLLVWRGEDAAMLLTPRPFAEEVFELLERYILMDRVELTRFWLNEPIVTLAGPLAPELLAGLMDPKPERAQWAGNPWAGWLSVNVAGLPCRVLGDGRFNVPVYRISTPPMVMEQLLNVLDEACRCSGGGLAGAAALERLRISSGVTVHGVDTGPRTIPLEAGLERAIDFDKGCFPGQEVLARMRNLGHPARTLVRLMLQGEHEPTPGTRLVVDGEDAGYFSSSITWTGLDRTEALGYLLWERREVPKVMVESGDRPLEALVTPLREERFNGPACGRGPRT